ncbi:MobH family relaxase [Pseudomonas hunanensis]|uniref:MobH family relaxase n=1 Tax=Pseudomonas hunanensis TaxID=1247546 RepID=UPI0030DDAAFA
MKRITNFLLGILGNAKRADAKLGQLSALKLENHPALQNLPDHLLAKLRDGDESVMRYPPFNEGCPAFIPSAYLLGLHDDKLRMIKGGVGFDEADYLRWIYPMLVNYADLVHMLPASEHHHHRGLGGLLRHGLEVAVNALSYAQTEVFDARDLPSRRDKRATVWRVAAIAAGLMHDVGKVITDLKVVSSDGALQWQPAIRTIPQWAESNQLERYFLRWVPDRHEDHKLQSLTLLERVIPGPLREWILEYGEDIYKEMTLAIAGQAPDRQLSAIVKRADSASVATDMRDHGGDASRAAAIGVPVASLVLDAIKRLMSKSYWEVNKPGSPIWNSTEGLYIQWAEACPVVIEDILKNGYKGVPRSSESLAAILLDFGIAKHDPNGDMYWSVAIHMLRKRDFDKTKKELWFKCLHIPDLEHVFNFDQRPTAVSVSFKKGDEVVEALASTTTQAADVTNVPITKKPGPKTPARKDVSPAHDTPAEGDKQTDSAATRGSIDAQLLAKPVSPKPAIQKVDGLRDALGLTPVGSGVDVRGSADTVTDDSLPGAAQPSVRPTLDGSEQATKHNGETIAGQLPDGVDDGDGEVDDEPVTLEDMLVEMNLLDAPARPHTQATCPAAVSAPAASQKQPVRDLLRLAIGAPEDKFQAVDKPDVQTTFDEPVALGADGDEALPVLPVDEPAAASHCAPIQKHHELPTTTKQPQLEIACESFSPADPHMQHKLSDGAVDRARAELSLLPEPLRKTIETVFEACSDKRKYTHDMRVEFAIDPSLMSEDELHDFVASPLVFKSMVDGFNGVSKKFGKTWVCLTYDATFLMAEYDTSFFPIDIETPVIDVNAVKRTIRRFCMPKIQDGYRSFYHLSKRDQTEIANYMGLKVPVFINILRVYLNSVKPSSSQATEIVYLGDS